MSLRLGIPLSLLHEATGHSITVALNNGEMYRGIMVESMNNWNCQLKKVTLTSKVIYLSRLRNFSLNFCKYVPLLNVSANLNDFFKFFDNLVFVESQKIYAFFRLC